MSTPPCPICLKHRGEGPLLGPVIYTDELLHVSHQAAGPLGHAFVETRRHVPHLDQLTDTEAAAVGRATARLAAGLRAELDVEHITTLVLGMAVPHFHQHVIVRHRGTPSGHPWWEVWPDGPRGDAVALARRLQGYLAA